VIGLHAQPEVQSVSEPEVSDMPPAGIEGDEPTVPPDVEDPPMDLPGRESPGPRGRAASGQNETSPCSTTSALGVRRIASIR
jgi:hypothetical protein